MEYEGGGSAVVSETEDDNRREEDNLGSVGSNTPSVRVASVVRDVEMGTDVVGNIIFVVAALLFVRGRTGGGEAADAAASMSFLIFCFCLRRYFFIVSPLPYCGTSSESSSDIDEESVEVVPAFPGVEDVVVVNCAE